MNLILYHNNSTPNTIGKDLTEIQATPIHLKAGVDIDNPLIKLRLLADVDSANYALIDYDSAGINYKKFYFIDKINYPNGKMVELQFRLDVLETYKDEILDAETIITKTENINYLTQSGLNDSRSEFEEVFGSVTLPDGETMLLLTLGGGGQNP